MTDIEDSSLVLQERGTAFDVTPHGDERSGSIRRLLDAASSEGFADEEGEGELYALSEPRDHVGWDDDDVDIDDDDDDEDDDDLPDDDDDFDDDEDIDDDDDDDDDLYLRAPFTYQVARR